MRRDSLRLLDIVGTANAVSGYLNGIGREQFLTGGLIQDAVLRQLTIAGEAVYTTSTAIPERHPSIPWRKIAGFRH